MAKFRVKRAMPGFALKVGDVVEGELIQLEDNTISQKAFMQHNVFHKGDKHYTYMRGVIYDFELIE